MAQCSMFPGLQVFGLAWEQQGSNQAVVCAACVMLPLYPMCVSNAAAQGHIHCMKSVGSACLWM